MPIVASAFFSTEELAALQVDRLPRHVAIIPDGNRRWARDHHSTTTEGHQYGANVVMDVVKAAKELRVKTLTIYTFSTENWSRTQEEIDALFFLLENYLKVQKQAMIDNGVKLCTIGDPAALPSNIREAVTDTKAATAHCEDINFVLALNYGSRDEIRRAARKLAQDVAERRRSPSEVTEEVFASYLDTAPYGDPELLIRTSGELRVSNFLLWQISYAELYTCDIFWPDFTPHHFYNAIREYQHRNRRVGS